MQHVVNLYALWYLWEIIEFHMIENHIFMISLEHGYGLVEHETLANMISCLFYQSAEIFKLISLKYRFRRGFLQWVTVGLSDLAGIEWKGLFFIFVLSQHSFFPQVRSLWCRTGVANLLGRSVISDLPSHCAIFNIDDILFRDRLANGERKTYLTIRSEIADIYVMTNRCAFMFYPRHARKFFSYRIN